MSGHATNVATDIKQALSLSFSGPFKEQSLLKQQHIHPPRPQQRKCKKWCYSIPGKLAEHRHIQYQLTVKHASSATLHKQFHAEFSHPDVHGPQVVGLGPGEQMQDSP